MVIDNADEEQLFFTSLEGIDKSTSDIRIQNDGMAQYIPECSHGSILVTTKDKQTGLRLSKGHPPIEVSMMTSSESEQLLRSGLGRETLVSSQLLALSSRLGHLPLALSQAAAFMEANTMMVDEYLNLLGKNDQRLVNVLDKGFETVGRDSEAPRTMIETLIISFEQIQKRDPLAGELLSLMSFFDRQAIPRQLLKEYDTDVGDMQLEIALGVLKSFSLVTVGKDQGLDVHGLVHFVTRKWVSEKGKFDFFARRAVLAVARAFSASIYTNRTLCGEYLPHVYSVLQLEFKEGVPPNEAITRATLMYHASVCLFGRGQWKLAADFAATAARQRRAVQRPENLDTLERMFRMAAAYCREGRAPEAERLCVPVVETLRTELGVDHPATTSCMLGLALIWDQLGRTDDAEGLLEECAHHQKRVLGPDHAQTMATLSLLEHMKSPGGDRRLQQLFEQAQCLSLTYRPLGDYRAMSQYDLHQFIDSTRLGRGSQQLQHSAGHPNQHDVRRQEQVAGGERLQRPISHEHTRTTSEHLWPPTSPASPHAMDQQLPHTTSQQLQSWQAQPVIRHRPQAADFLQPQRPQLTTAQLSRLPTSQNAAFQQSQQSSSQKSPRGSSKRVTSKRVTSKRATSKRVTSKRATSERVRVIIEPQSQQRTPQHSQMTVVASPAHQHTSGRNALHQSNDTAHPAMSDAHRHSAAIQQVAHVQHLLHQPNSIVHQAPSVAHQHSVAHQQAHGQHTLHQRNSTTNQAKSAAHQHASAQGRPRHCAACEQRRNALEQIQQAARYPSGDFWELGRSLEQLGGAIQQPIHIAEGREQDPARAMGR